MTFSDNIALLGPAFLSTPYRRYPYGAETAYVHACCLAAKLMKAGIHDLFCPIAMAHGIARYGLIDPFDNEFWLKAYAGQLSRAGVLLVGTLPGWIESDGIKEEIAAFKNSSEPVVLGIAHPNYGHMAVMPPETRAELARDFE